MMFFHVELNVHKRHSYTTREIVPDQWTFQMGYARVAKAPTTRLGCEYVS